MGFFDQLNKSKGGYIFLSHSHDDIEIVRKIRNSLEEDGFEPLCFYLKCLNDESEIEDLIKREIDAREWFVFVNSENSRKSKWVTLEREYILKKNNKKIITVDIDDENAVSKALQKITHNLRVFISHSAKDNRIAGRMRDRLEEKDFLVFSPVDSFSPDASYVQTVTNAISEASLEGCVIVLITQNSAKSVHMRNEIDYAYSKGGSIIPVMVGDVELSDILKYYLYRYHLYYLSENPTDREIDDMIDSISYRITGQQG